MFNAVDNYVLSLPTVFNAAIYVRLSREDEDREGNSESIKNQIDFLTSTVIENAWNLVDTYIDDGYTGTNFDRPAFKRMIRDIESKRVNLVIVKDLSRLGRDYIETGNYMEKYFPSKNVRFIAVNDGIDSFANSSSNDMSPFKSVINDLYTKDISKKVRSAFDTKRSNGKFIGSFAPYGYQKDPMDKNKLITNPETAPVVKRIYELYISGCGLRQIAITLNSEGIQSPALYKMNTSSYRGGRTKNFIWAPETIRLILSNPTYAGNVAQKKIEKINYKIKKHKNVPRDSWVVVDNTHDPIIDSSSFELTQQLLDKKGYRYKNAPQDWHLLAGILYCGDCGSKMTFLTGSNGSVYAVCSKYKRFKLCTRHSFPEGELVEGVIGELRDIAEKVLNLKELEEQAKKQTEKIRKASSKDFEKDISPLEKRLSEIKGIIKNLYEDKVRGVISESDFIELSQTYNAERESVFASMERLKKEYISSRDQPLDMLELSELVKDFIGFNSPDRLTLVKLINKIEIFENKILKIYYNFKCPI